ncbi:MAG: peptidase M10, partial [Nitrosomonadaceae bacterium]|nr:peptidase M10 [Nitrosomonadaceae bacterium]
FGDGEPWRSDFTTLTTADQAAFVKALQQWANVANLNFVPVVETPSAVGDIRAAYTSDPDELTLAWAYLPSTGPYAGDIWINTNGLLNFQEWNPGNISYESVLHELGHALGLTHPFADPDDPSKPVLPKNQDSVIHTIMSYTYADLQGVEGNEFSFHPTTPMVLDIAAIQYLYGANTRYHTGNDTYTYNDANTYHETLWDAGGASDTIHYEGAISSVIDLNPGNGSFIGQPVYVQLNGVNIGQPVPNVWIANNVTIENAIAGQGNDILIGNSSRNTLDGGAGIDTVQAGSARSQFTLNKTSDGYTLTDNANPGNQDTLINIERVKFADAHVAIDLDGHAG